MPADLHPPEASNKWVATRAFEIWDQAGRPEGRAEEHWYQAERELGELRSVGDPIDRS